MSEIPPTTDDRAGARRPTIGVTMGDPLGVGAEVVVKALADPALRRRARRSEHSASGRLLRQVPAGDLVLWDCGFYGYSLLAQAVEQGTHVLCRVPAYARLRPIRYLPDGSYLAKVRPNWRHGRWRRPLTVRVLEYRLDDPGRPGRGERHRLATTLLDAERYPARELI